MTSVTWIRSVRTARSASSQVPWCSTIKSPSSRLLSREPHHAQPKSLGARLGRDIENRSSSGGGDPSRGSQVPVAHPSSRRSMRSSASRILTTAAMDMRWCLPCIHAPKILRAHSDTTASSPKRFSTKFNTRSHTTKSPRSKTNSRCAQ